MQIGKLFIVITAFCVCLAAPVRAGIPPVLVEQTVQVLVSRGYIFGHLRVKSTTFLTNKTRPCYLGRV